MGGLLSITCSANCTSSVMFLFHMCSRNLGLRSAVELGLCSVEYASVRKAGKSLYLIYVYDIQELYLCNYVSKQYIQFA